MQICTLFNKLKHNNLNSMFAVFNFHDLTIVMYAKIFQIKINRIMRPLFIILIFSTILFATVDAIRSSNSKKVQKANGGTNSFLRHLTRYLSMSAVPNSAGLAPSQNVPILSKFDVQNWKIPTMARLVHSEEQLKRVSEKLKIIS